MLEAAGKDANTASEVGSVTFSGWLKMRYINAINDECRTRNLSTMFCVHIELK
jgi:hypothetical protein